MSLTANAAVESLQPGKNSAVGARSQDLNLLAIADWVMNYLSI